MKDISEATGPTKVVKTILEADLQDQCVRWYRSRGEEFWARKFSSMSQRSVPDYLFSRYVRCLGPDDFYKSVKIKFACEFKRPGCPINKETGVMSTRAQVEEQEAMRLAGWFVFECDNFDKFKATVLAYETEIMT